MRATRPLLASVLLVGLSVGEASAQQNPEDFIEEITPEPEAEPGDDEGDPGEDPVGGEEEGEEPVEPEPSADEEPSEPPQGADDRGERGRDAVDDDEDTATPKPAERRGGRDAERPAKPKRRAKAKRAGNDEVEEEQVGELGGVAEIRELSYPGLLERWDARRQAAGSEPAVFRRAEAIFVEGMAELGLQGLDGGLGAPDLAHALVVESRAAREKGDVGRAEELLQLALRASPDSPGVRLYRAEHELAVGSLADAFVALVESVKATLRSPDHLAAASARASAALALALLALLTVVAVTSLARAFRYLVFDLWAVLPRGAARWQVTTLLAIAAVVPLIAGAGPVLTLLLWLTLAWLYLDGRTQVVVAVVGVLGLSLPLLVGFGARLFSYQGSKIDRAFSALVDVGADDERSALVERGGAAASLLPAQVALAEAAFREGRLDDAGQRWRKVVKSVPEAAWAHNNLGVLAAMEGNEELALVAFNDALGKDPAHLTAAYNISLLKMRNPRREKLSPEVQGLLDKGGADLEQLRSVTFRRGGQKVSQNRAYVWAPMPRDVIEVLWLTPPDASASFEAETARLLYLGLRPYAAMGLIGAFLLVWFALSRLRSRLLPSKPCRECGTPASKRYDADEVPDGICSACYHAVVSTKGQIDAAVRSNKERQIAAHQRSRSRRAILWSLLFPGAGHLALGAAFLGLGFALVFALSLGAVLAVALAGLPWPSPPIAEATWLLWGPPAAISILVYLVAVRSASQVEEG